MAATKKAKSKKTPIKKKETPNMGKIQSTICRDIMDTAEVTKSAVATEIIAKLSENSSRQELKEVVKVVNAKIDEQAGQLVNRVLKNLD